VCGHTTCFGLYGHLQVCKIFSFLLGRLAVSHLRLIRFPFRRLLRLTGITVGVQYSTLCDERTGLQSVVQFVSGQSRGGLITVSSETTGITMEVFLPASVRGSTYIEKSFFCWNEYFLFYFIYIIIFVIYIYFILLRFIFRFMKTRIWFSP
jgi:hypothetical protein